MAYKLITVTNIHKKRSFWNHDGVKCKPGVTVQVRTGMYKDLVKKGYVEPIEPANDE